ncbi:unnamed protein product [Auanema sp. JU1783]|nr:unnamed protein product [Auanema sp. JU1783]
MKLRSKNKRSVENSIQRSPRRSRGMEWLRGRVFGSRNDDEEHRQKLVEQTIAAQSRNRSMMGAKPSSQVDNQGYQVSPIGDSCTAASSTNLMPAPRHDRRYDAQRVSQARCTRSLSPAHPHRANNGLDDMQRPYKFDLILRTPPPDASTQESHAWNPEDRSMNIFVKDDDKFTFHRHPVAQSTDCIRGKTGYSRGFHVWQLEWPGRQRGTHAVVGVGTKGASLHAVGYTSLIGTDEESYGWDLTRGECYHDSKHCAPWTYPMDVNGRSGDDYSVPDKFFCILDMDEGFLAFATEKDYLGVAFRNLKGKTVYPIVSAVWGHCEITMKYLGGLEPQPRDLLEICRNKIRRELGVTRLARVDELQIPPRLKQYVVFG